MSDVTMVRLPFRSRFREPMRCNVKLMTCRTEKMASPGDRFEAFGAVFEVTHVMRMRLGYVASDCFLQEGCVSYQDFLDLWGRIHPTKGFDPEQIVWAHCFKQVEVRP